MSTRRISTERLACLAAELTTRDRAVIAMLAAVKLATGNQLRRATLGDDSESGQRAARRELARLVRWRVVARLERRQGGLGRGSDSWTYALDVAGQRLFDQTGARRPRLPGRPMWAHALVGTEVYTRLIEATRGTDQTVSEWQGEPACWRTFNGGYNERLQLKPDAFVIVSGPEFEDVCFVEIDTGSQSRTVIRSKLETYRRYAATGQEQAARDGVFPLTAFITTTAARHAVLLDLIGELPPETWRLFVVGQVADAARLLTGGAS
jgi:protein involved in plasmid replication-relaxation